MDATVFFRRKLGAMAGQAVGIALFCLANGATAQDSVFAPGWDLSPDQSNLRFQSIKTTSDGLKVESSSFASFSGAIQPDGTANVTIMVESVDTAIDLRNVRMRFLFFETFKFPEAQVTMTIPPEAIADLAQVRRKTLDLPYTLSLHGFSAEKTSQVSVTLLADDLVSVSSAAPISIAVADFGLAENITKLEQAAGNITIVPTATVTFDFVFQRRGGGGSGAAPLPAVTAPVAVSAALEPEGDFSREACEGRFEILSRTGNIYFRTGSARLQSESAPMLDAIVDIVDRCPDLNVIIGGHTDSDGGASANQRLSEQRAAAVLSYISAAGIPANRMKAVGFGEAKPVAPNDSATNKRLNRRIEFAVDGG